MGRTGGVAELIGWWKEHKRNRQENLKVHHSIEVDEKLPIDLVIMLDELERDCDPCLAKASKHEPIFVLRAQDALAPDAISVWMSDYRTYVLRNSEISDGKLQAAEKCVEEMQRWPSRKMPD